MRDSVVKVTVTDHECGKFVVAQTVYHPAKPIQPDIIRIFIYTRIFVRPSKTKHGVLDYTDLTICNLRGYIPPNIMSVIICIGNKKDYENMVKHCQEKKLEKE